MNKSVFSKVVCTMFIISILFYTAPANAGFFKDVINQITGKKPDHKPPENPPMTQPSNPPTIEIKANDKKEPPKELKCQDDEKEEEGKCVKK